MTQKEFEIEAKSRYPIGCKVDQKTAYNGLGDIYEITTNITDYYDNLNGYYNGSIGDIGVYSSQYNKWAEIVEYPKEAVINLPKFAIMYNDSINVYDFARLLDRLNSLGYTKYTYLGWRVDFETFKVKGWIRTATDREDDSNQPINSFMIDNNSQSLPVKKISDFINIEKELTSLPEKWCIRDCAEVSKYASTKFHCGGDISDRIFHQGNGSYWNNYTFRDGVEEGFTEITFDQFKKWVLKESKISMKTSDNSYNQYLTVDQLVKGEIYSVECDTDRFLVKHLNKYLYIKSDLEGFICGGFNYTCKSYKITKAIFSDRQWLEVLIKANKFIPKKEALNGKVDLDNDWDRVKVKHAVEALLDNDYKSPLSYLTDYVVNPPKDDIKYEWNVMSRGNHMSSFYKMGIDPYETVKSNDLEFQQPVIIKNKNKKSKLTIINQ